MLFHMSDLKDVAANTQNQTFNAVFRLKSTKGTTALHQSGGALAPNRATPEGAPSKVVSRGFLWIWSGNGGFRKPARLAEIESMGRNWRSSGARDAPHSDRDGRAPNPAILIA
jgi:hypothetical protein